MPIDKALYRSRAIATDGHDGRATSSDNALDVKLTTPDHAAPAPGRPTGPSQASGGRRERRRKRV